MAVPIWPAVLPQKVAQDSYSETLPDGRLRTQTDTGPGKMRLRTLATKPVNITLPPATFDVKAQFEAFWLEDTQGGVLPFWIPDQTRDELWLSTEDDVGITTEDDVPIVTTDWWLAMFDAAPVISPWPSAGTLWRISFSLSVLP